MADRTTAIVWDVVAIAVALWFIFGARFEAWGNPITHGVAALVILTSAWRLLRRRRR